MTTEIFEKSTENGNKIKSKRKTNSKKAMRKVINKCKFVLYI